MYAYIHTTKVHVLYIFKLYLKLMYYLLSLSNVNALEENTGLKS